jgi:hypothetical protein
MFASIRFKSKKLSFPLALLQSLFYSTLQIEKSNFGESGYFEQIKDAEDGSKPETEVSGKNEYWTVSNQLTTISQIRPILEVDKITRI